ncbi:hypothetical protein KUCAC02_003539, partial [Chaenocephalus aceratus]
RNWMEANSWTAAPSHFSSLVISTSLSLYPAALALTLSPSSPSESHTAAIVGEGEDCTQTTDLRVKTEPVCKLEPASPDPPPAEDQTEPVDLSLNKPRPSSLPSSAAGTTMNPAPSGMGAGGQQILHVIHTIPSVSMPSKVGQLQTIPVVVQSLPVVYTHDD